MDNWLPENEPSWVIVFFETLFFLLLCYWAYNLIFTHSTWILLDGVNLLIHEAGHAVFSFGGMFLHMIAGSVLQLIVPFVFFIYFFRKHSRMGEAFALFWTGESAINVSIYIKDARTMLLDLIGGGIHDWNWILSQTGLLEYDQIIGGVVFISGSAVIIAGLLLMAYTILSEIYKLNAG